jgi:hypothetical protein
MKNSNFGTLEANLTVDTIFDMRPAKIREQEKPLLGNGRVNMQLSPACKNVSPEIEDRPPLKPLPSNVIENTHLQFVVTSCKSVQ